MTIRHNTVPNNRLDELHQGGRASIADRLFAWRDRLIASRRFQRIAAAVPGIRAIARRHERALFDLCAGFVYSQVLLACVRLRLFERLADRPRTVPELAQTLDIPEEAAQRLLDAAVSLKLLSRRGGGRYGLGMLGAAMAGDPGIAAMVEHHAHLYTDLADPVALLRGQRKGGLAHYWPYASVSHPETLAADDVGAYTALMAASQPLVAQEVLDAFDLRPHRCLLDVGGGDGTFLSAVAERAPRLRLMLFDLPAVAEQAAVRLGARATTHGGSFLTDALPSGADIITLVRIALDHDDETVLTVLRAAWKALPPGGVLLIAEPMSGARGAEPVADAYFGIYLMAMGRGRPRTPDHLMALLREAGFAGSKLIHTRRPLLARVLTSRKPG